MYISCFFKQRHTFSPTHKHLIYIIKGGYPHTHVHVHVYNNTRKFKTQEHQLSHLTYARDDSLLLYVLGHPSHHSVRLPGPRLTVGKDTNIVPTKYKIIQRHILCMASQGQQLKRTILSIKLGSLELFRSLEVLVHVTMATCRLYTYICTCIYYAGSITIFKQPYYGYNTANVSICGQFITSCQDMEHALA